MKKYAIYKRNFEKENYFHYIETLDGIKNVRLKYGNIFFGQRTKAWYKLDIENSTEYFIKSIKNLEKPVDKIY